MMEKLVTLKYGNFTIEREQVKKCAQRTSCSNRVANQTHRGQLYVNELRREQEWGLFLLEHLLHNAASMSRKECQRHSQALQAETAKVTSPEHPSVRTLLGSTDAKILKITKHVYQGECVVAPNMLPADDRRSV